MNYLTTLYRNRFSLSEQVSRNVMWQAIYDFSLKEFIDQNGTVMDIGAGNCELLNLIKCKFKYAIDLNLDTKKSANKNVKVLNLEVKEIPNNLNGKINTIIMSNFLEHLNSKDDVIAVLNRSYKLLKNGGKVIILQPNIDLIKEAYWDFVDHKIALNTKSLIELLCLTKFNILQMSRRFLPYTTKSFFPISRLVIYLYLKIPTVIRPFAGQSFVVGVKK